MFAKIIRKININRLYATKPTEHQAAMMARSLPKKVALPGVDHILVVSSGKGGVGKSTVAANLAVSMASLGKRVGLLDADIFGPSIPLMLNVHEEPMIDNQNLMLPPINYGVKCLSMGLLTKPDDAVIWRGPLVMSALHRLLKGAAWGPLDILVVDTPPGTGDVHLSLTQNVPLTGVILVSTPQIAALEITLRGAQMYRKFGVPILGLIENMGHAICDKCQNRMEFFHSETEKFAAKMKAPVLTSLPLDKDVTTSCDSGIPVVLSKNKLDYREKFENLANNIFQQLEKSKVNNEKELKT